MLKLLALLAVGLHDEYCSLPCSLGSMVEGMKVKPSYKQEQGQTAAPRIGASPGAMLLTLAARRGSA